MMKQDVLSDIREVLIGPATFCMVVSEQLLKGQLGTLDDENLEIIRIIYKNSLAQFQQLKLTWEMYSKGDFRTLAQRLHDALSPLSVVITHCDYALYLMTTFSAKQRGRIQAIMWKMYHLRRQLYNLNDYAQLEANVVRTVEPMLANLALDAGRKNVMDDRLQWDVPHDLPRIYGNDLYVARTMMNLLDNALRWTKKAPVNVSVSIDEAYVRFHIRDDGDGIAPMIDAVLYHPFMPMNITKHHLGLGLHIANRFMQLQGGAITLDGRWPSGTVATMTLRRV